jgi:hypothetical protein
VRKGEWRRRQILKVAALAAAVTTSSIGLSRAAERATMTMSTSTAVKVLVPVAAVLLVCRGRGAPEEWREEEKEEE